jgi:hypothetical protein
MADEHTPLVSHDSRASQAHAVRRTVSSRKWGWKRKLLVFLILLGTPVAYVFLLRYQRPRVPHFIDHEFGVGFDLTSPYGYVDTPL